VKLGEFRGFQRKSGDSGAGERSEEEF